MGREQLQARLAALTLRDAARLSRRVARSGQLPPEVERQLQAAEARAARRLAALPMIGPDSYPPDLPVSARVEDLLAAMARSQVVVVAGATGSGKTTQLPKVCLQAGGGRRGAIAVTQPRRIAARAVAERLAEELGVPLGGAVGYAVRFDRRSGADTLVTVMTDGVLLAELTRDPDLLGYDTVILDEAHERSLNIDFLLGYLSRLVVKRPELRVVITSATIDPQRFADHFGGAEVLEVSGRSYPVEIRYRPQGASTPDEDAGAQEPDLPADVLAAIREVMTAGPGDVLVFLSGEREIRDVAEVLERDLPPERGIPVHILPLYGRLSAAEQHRVFAPARGRRVVLATNVAETSLTVPGIHYVVDPGTARISRYSTRLKVQRLPIEKISQASAQQRAGRCGRVAAGICIRLYDEADFLARPEFTDPEIARTNLAAVLLRMADLRLGPIRDFPFLDPPDPKAVRDGVRLLRELGAVRDATAETLTPVGRQMARLPLDPRLGRMVVEADRLGCLGDVLVLAAGMTVQDVRERPGESDPAGRAAADASHARFADPAGDLAGLLSLWRYLEKAQADRSRSAFRRACRAEYLHYQRIREWQDLVAQLRDIATESLGMTVPAADGADSADSADSASSPALVARAVLAGLLSHIGAYDPKRRDYLGARSTRFSLWPGSSLASRPPRYVVAAELVATSRLFGRTVARVDPVWIEQAAGDLVARSVGPPFWDAGRAAVLAEESVSLFGVPLVAGRRVNYARINPVEARAVFLQHALVERQWDAGHAFLTANEARRAEAGQLCVRLRLADPGALRSDAPADAPSGPAGALDAALYAFYDRVVPTDAVSARHFDAWWRVTRREDPHRLDVALGDLLPGLPLPAAGDFPDELVIDGHQLSVDYRFEPGDPRDGISVELPLVALHAVSAAALSWPVPGRRADTAEALLRGLPKQWRRALVPVPDTVAAVLPALGGPTAGVSFPDALAEALARTRGVVVPPEAFTAAEVPTWLRTHLVVLDTEGRELAHGDDLAELRRRLAPQLLAAVRSAAAGQERSGLRSWPDGLPEDTIAEQVALRSGERMLRGYPALSDEGSTAGLRVFTSPEIAAAAHLRGLARLLVLAAGPEPRRLLDRLDGTRRLSLAALPGVTATELAADCLDAAARAVVASHAGTPVRSRPAWEGLVAAARPRLGEDAARLLGVVAGVHATAAQLRSRVAGLRGAAAARGFSPALDDIDAQLTALVPPRVASTVGAARLANLPRYLAGVGIRLDRLGADPGRDAARMASVRDLEQQWRAALAERTRAGAAPSAALTEVGWMLQELRVSLFAQQLGTAHPVSERRVLAALAGA